MIICVQENATVKPIIYTVLHANRKSKVQKIKYVFMSCNTIEAENYELLKLLEISHFFLLYVI